MNARTTGCPRSWTHDVPLRRWLAVADPTTDDVAALGTLLAGEVDGKVDELAAHILASSWLAQRDARIRAEALQDAADDLALLVDSQHPEAANPDQWLRDRADRIEALP